MMKLLLLHIFAATAVVHCTYDDNAAIATHLGDLFRVERSLHDFGGLKLNSDVRRSKRDSIDDCVNNCEEVADEDFIAKGLTGPVYFTTLNKKLYDRSNFDQACRIIMTQKRCLKNCAADMSDIRESMHILPYQKFMCQDKITEFRAALPCLRKSAGDVEAMFFSQCGNVSEVYNEIRMKWKAGIITTFEQNREICNLRSCLVTSESRATIKVCEGDWEAKLLASLNEIGFSWQKNMLDAAGGMNDWPQACDDRIEINHAISTHDNITEEFLSGLFNATSYRKTTEELMYPDSGTEEEFSLDASTTESGQTDAPLAPPIFVTNIDDCVNNCLEVAYEDSIQMGLTGPVFTMLNKKLYDRSNFDQHCRIILTKKRCLKNCAADMSDIRESTHIEPFLNYMCQDKITEFRAALPCLRKSAGDVEAMFFSQCGNVSEVYNEIRMKWKAGIITTFEQNREMCNLWSCLATSESRAINNVCEGDREVKLLASFSEIIEASNRKALLDAPGGTNNWPQACDDKIEINHAISTHDNITEEFLSGLFNATSYRKTTEELMYPDSGTEEEYSLDASTTESGPAEAVLPPLAPPIMKWRDESQSGESSSATSGIHGVTILLALLFLIIGGRKLMSPQEY